MLSGFWHQVHLSGQPLKNMVVLMPGPSSVDNLWISSIVATDDELFFAIPGLVTSVAFAGNDLILEFSADGGEIRVIPRYSYQQCTIIFRMVLRVFQHVGIQHIYLQ